MSDNILEQASAEAILDHTGEGIYVTDLDCRIVFWNKPAERITGWKASEVVGRRCRDDILVHIDRHGNSLCMPGRCPLHKAMASGEPCAASLVFANHREGRRIPVAISVSPLFGKDGRVIGGVEVFRDESERMRQLEQARRIQLHALSPELPQKGVRVHALYKPQEMVGGDFYQVEATPDGYALILADFAGHGLGAALYTMTMRTLWQENSRHLQHPAKLMSRINQTLEKLTVGDSFATAFAAHVEPASGLMTYSSAGHTTAMLRAVDGRVSLLGPTDLALGMLAETQFVQESLIIKPGELLLVYSDAALETVDLEGRMFGQDRLARILAQADPNQPEKLLTTIEQALSNHAQSPNLDDDLTMLTVALAPRD